jgi:hypothetical protein
MQILMHAGDHKVLDHVHGAVLVPRAPRSMQGGIRHAWEARSAVLHAVCVGGDGAVSQLLPLDVTVDASLHFPLLLQLKKALGRSIG